jgi:hypothetical protein
MFGLERGGSPITYVLYAGVIALMPDVLDWVRYSQVFEHASMERLERTEQSAVDVLRGGDAFEQAVTRINRVHEALGKKRSKDTGSEMRISGESIRDVSQMLFNCQKITLEYLRGRPLTALELKALYAIHLEAAEALGATGMPASHLDFGWNAPPDLGGLVAGPDTEWILQTYKNALPPGTYRIVTGIWASLLPPELVQRLELKKDPLVDTLLRIYPHVRNEKAEAGLVDTLKRLTLLAARLHPQRREARGTASSEAIQAGKCPFHLGESA